MLKKSYPIWLVGLLIVFLAFACSDDEDAPTQPTTPTMDHTPTPLNVGVPAAMAQSNDQYAQMATGWVDAISGFDSLFTFFIPPSKAAKASVSYAATADTITWSWSNGVITIKLQFWESATHYHWRYIWHGTVGEEVYDNWVWFYANEAKDGSEGHFYWYDNNSTNAMFTWSWTYASGIYNITYLLTDGSNSLRITAVINVDGSGQVEYYINDVLSIRIVWYADGSGAWWTYNPDANGTWAVAKE